MSFFKNLFGKKAEERAAAPQQEQVPVSSEQQSFDNPSRPVSPYDPSDPAFEALFKDALSRYFSVPGQEVQLAFGKGDGTFLTMNEMFSEAYAESGQIQSTWDKRSVLYGALDELYLSDMERWQVMERYIIDRYPEKALAFATMEEKPDNSDPDFLAAFARALFFNSEYESAIAFAKGALQVQPGHKRARVVLADALHLSGKHAEAHEIYHALLDEALPKDTKMELSVFDLVCFRNDILHSSVYAVAMLQSAPVEAIWNAVAEEFYHCPYFRSQHAYFLIRNDNGKKGLVKLVSLTQEYPGFKDGVVNAHNVIRQFRSQLGAPDFMQEDFERIEAIMKEKGWEPVGN